MNFPWDRISCSQPLLYQNCDHRCADCFRALDMKVNYSCWHLCLSCWWFWMVRTLYYWSVLCCLKSVLTCHLKSSYFDSEHFVCLFLADLFRIKWNHNKKCKQIIINSKNNTDRKSSIHTSWYRSRFLTPLLLFCVMPVFLRPENIIFRPVILRSFQRCEPPSFNRPNRTTAFVSISFSMALKWFSCVRWDYLDTTHFVCCCVHIVCLWFEQKNRDQIWTGTTIWTANCVGKNDDSRRTTFQVFVFIKFAKIMSNWAKSIFSLK